MKRAHYQTNLKQIQNHLTLIIERWFERVWCKNVQSQQHLSKEFDHFIEFFFYISGNLYTPSQCRMTSDTYTHVHTNTYSHARYTHTHTHIHIPASLMTLFLYCIFRKLVFKRLNGDSVTRGQWNTLPASISQSS